MEQATHHGGSSWFVGCVAVGCGLGCGGWVLLVGVRARKMCFGTKVALIDGLPEMRKEGNQRPIRMDNFATSKVRKAYLLVRKES